MLDNQEVVQLFAEGGAFPVKEVADCLAVIEREYGVPIGLLRPPDSIRMLVAPVKSRNPVKWYAFEACASQDMDPR